MSSEYLQWLARDEKPAEKRELTPEEKRRNWWDYHWKHVLIGAAALIFVMFFVADIIEGKNNQPDYQLAYIGASYLPDDTAEILQTALADYGEDLNGDGKVLIQLNQYLLYTEDTSTAYAAQVQALCDNASFIFLTDDPVRYQEQFAVMAYPDGTIPAEDAPVDEDLWYGWEDCPVLTALDLGTYTQDFAGSGENRDVLSPLSVARRAIWDGEDFANLDANIAFWEALTAGAK